MSREVITVGSTMRIPLLYQGEYSQWRERFMNYFEEQTDVSLAGTTSNVSPPLKDKSMWTAEEKKNRNIDHALERHMLGSEYGEQDRKAAVLYEYETFKATKRELLLNTYIRYLQVINDLKKCGYKKDN
ncbi:hypothetical protein Tco_1098005, partial [Tanacetum coccineum]